MTGLGTTPGGTTGRAVGDRAVLAVEDLHVYYQRPRRRLLRRAGPPVQAVNGVTFEITEGTTFGLVGESGSGKSTLARAVLRLVPPTAGRVLADGHDITEVGEPGYRERVQAVLQDPYSTLNPAHPVSVIVGDAVTRHQRTTRGPARDDAVAELLDLVGLPGELLRRFPHELSGGQRQRVSIARALAAGPDLLIADEPTSALDVSVQSQIINLLKHLQADYGQALLVISHDLQVVNHLADRIGVMYAGHLVEHGSTSLQHHPAHPYTEMLTASAPVPDPTAQAARRQARRTFTTSTSAGIDTGGPSSQGCPFAGRCPAAFGPCTTTMPEPSTAHHGGTVRCHLHTTGPTLAGQPVGAHLQSTDSH